MLLDENTFDNADGLFIRQKIMDRIYSAVLAKGNMAIHGLPLMGKTSILKGLALAEPKNKFVQKNKQPLRGNEDISQYIFIYIDLERYLLKTYEKFFDTLCNHIVGFCKKTINLKYDEEKIDEGFMEILDQVNEQGFRLVLLFDTFDIFIKNEYTYEILTYLRSCTTARKVSYVTASSAPLYQLCRELRNPSPFYNVFSFFSVEALSFDEAQNFIQALEKQLGIVFERHEINWILRYAGLHPFFIKKACEVLVNEKLNVMKEEVTEKHFRNKASFALWPHFEDIWTHLNEPQRSYLINEAQLKNREERDIPELSESGFFRQFVRDICKIDLFKMDIDELENALDKFNNAEALGATNLQLMMAVRRQLRANITPTQVELGKVVREVLKEALERLRGTGERTDADPEWISYNILSYRYMSRYRLKHREIAARLGIIERQYYRKRNNALEELLQVLFDMEGLE